MLILKGKLIPVILIGCLFFITPFSAYGNSIIEQVDSDTSLETTPEQDSIEMSPGKIVVLVFISILTLGYVVFKIMLLNTLATLWYSDIPSI